MNKESLKNASFHLVLVIWQMILFKFVQEEDHALENIFAAATILLNMEVIDVMFLFVLVFLLIMNLFVTKMESVFHRIIALASL